MLKQTILLARSDDTATTAERMGQTLADFCEQLDDLLKGISQHASKFSSLTAPASNSQFDCEAEFRTCKLLYLGRPS
jgi:hypothetical protein